MNTVDCIVNKVLGKPYEINGRWFVRVEYKAYGGEFYTSLVFETEALAKQIDKGYKFLC